MRVLLAEVKHHGNAWNVRKLLMDPAAVIGNRGVDVHARGGQKRDLTAPTVAHHAHLARGPDMVDGSLNVHHNLIVIQGRHVAKALLAVAVGDIDFTLHPIEQRRRNGEVSRRGKLLRHVANMARDAEYLLYHNDAAPRFAAG